MPYFVKEKPPHAAKDTKHVGEITKHTGENYEAHRENTCALLKRTRLIVISSQLSFNHIAIVIQSHRNCHVIASQLSFDRIAAVVYMHGSCRV